MRKFNILEIGLALICFVPLISLWNTEISVDIQFIPTIVNGLATSMSLIMGFTAALVTFGFANPLFKLGENIDRIVMTIIILTLPIAMLWKAYGSLMGAQFQSALKEAMTGFLFSVVLILDLVAFLVVKATEEK